MILPHLALALALLGPAPRQDAQQELQAIQKEFEQETKELQKALKAAADDGARREMQQEFRQAILPEFAARYAGVARANRGQPAGLEAWTRVLALVPRGLGGELPGEALTALTSDHLQSEQLYELAANLRWDAAALGEERALEALRKIASSSPHRTVQAAALYSLGAVLGEERAADDPRVAEAKQVLARLAAYDDVQAPNKESYAKAAATLLFVLENLSPGRPCPDFSAVDAEGAGFKLSDYKGKVVLIDFWGFW